MKRTFSRFPNLHRARNRTFWFLLLVVVFLLHVSPTPAAQVDSYTPKEQAVRVLLPHEILHALSGHPFAFDSLIKGNMSDESRMCFWKHCRRLEGWRGHPALSSSPLDRLVPITLHNDGAQMYTDDEFCVWSVASLFGSVGLVQDPLLQKFPFVIIAERHMRSEAVPRSLVVGLAQRTQAMCSCCFFAYMYWDHGFGARPCVFRLTSTKTVCSILLMWSHKHLSIPDPPRCRAQVRKQVNTTVAQLFAWSIQISMDGKAPSVGFFEEELTGYRAEIAGQQLAKGWRNLTSKNTDYTITVVSNNKLYPA